MGNVSIVIPTVKERGGKLRHLLKSIDQSIYQDCEVLVEESLEGLAIARNRGARRASGKYVLFIDDDNVIDPDMIDQLVRALDQQNQPDGFKSLIAVGPVTYYLAEPERVWFAGAEYSFWTSKPRFYTVGVRVGRDRPENETGESRLAPTMTLHNCFMVKREVGERVGWFDERLIMGGTEVDFFMRARPAVAAVHLDAKCYHDIPTPEQDRLRSWGFNHPRRAYYFQRNRGLLIGRYGSLIQKFVFGLVFYPFFTLGYGMFFVLQQRWSLLKAHLRGTVEGYKRLICAVF